MALHRIIAPGPPATPIHQFTFVNMTRPPSEKQERLNVISQAGTDGQTIWKTGTRPNPYQVMTMVDHTTLADAVNLFRDYAEIIGSDPAQLIWAGNDYDVANIRVIPMSVELVAVREVVLGVGGVTGSSGATLRCVWTLLPVAYTPP